MMGRQIQVLDQTTIDKIAAGEVVERPASVVKELVENAIDAGATAITVEIKDGGISFIRITDNGAGIEKNQVRLAFLRHATSKIREVEDLLQISSLGFRGEALSSISAVSQVELITKPHEQLTGVRYLIEGGAEKKMEEIGAPNGTTFLIRNLFYNTPARAKFLKTPATEAGYISNFMEQLALSHPHISFKYMQNGQTKLHTSGNNNRKEVIYQIYGRDLTKQLIEIHHTDLNGTMQIDGFIGKPTVSRGNRNFENYYVNGRYVKSKLIMKGIEDAYHTFMMQHKYPFTSLEITIRGEDLDINVHPTKMEVRFSRQQEIYQLVYDAVLSGLQKKELIPEVSLREEPKKTPICRPKEIKVPEPFEYERKKLEGASDLPAKIKESNPYTAQPTQVKTEKENILPTAPERKKTEAKAEQMTLFDNVLLSKKSKQQHQLIGQVFDTYWLVQMNETLYIIDQHAAHEKVLYERIRKEMRGRKISSQFLSPPMIISLNLQEQETMQRCADVFAQMGFEIESFGGLEYSIRAVPQNLYGLTEETFFIEILDHLADEVTSQNDADALSDKMATMACKAAVKGNQTLSAAEAKALIDELLELENPYNCPHGRPTIISMTKYELEKKFKRIV